MAFSSVNNRCLCSCAWLDHLRFREYGYPWEISAYSPISVTEQTYYRWKKKYGGMGIEQLKKLKRLQKENECLRRAVSDLTLDKLILKEAALGNF
jgi:hypothetical protein